MSKLKPTTFIHIYIYIERERESWVHVTPSVILNNITPLNNLLLYANFNKSTVGLHYIHIFSMFTKFHDDQRLIIILSIAKSLVTELAPPHAQSAWGSREKGFELRG